VYKKSLFTQLSLHALTVILVFIISSSFSFTVHYRTEAVVRQNILMTTVQHPPVILLWRS